MPTTTPYLSLVEPDRGQINWDGLVNSNWTILDSWASSVNLSFNSVSQSFNQNSLLKAVTLSGNTTGTLAGISSGTLTLAGGNNITLSQQGNAVTISGPNTVAQSVQTQNLVSINGSTGSIVIVAGNNITLSQNASTISINAQSQSVQPIGTQTAGISNLGNTSGTTGVATGTGVQIVLAGGNNITLSQSLNGSSATITVSAASQSVQPEGTQTLGISNLGNTLGTSGVATGTGIQFIFAGGNNITLSQSLNGSSGTVTIVGAAGGGGSFSGGISGGNTSGNTGTVSNQIVFAGGNNITLSGSTNAGGMSVTVSGPNTVAQTVQTLGIYGSSQTVGQSSSSTVDARSFTHVGQGIISVGMSAGSLLISATTAQSVQPVGTDTVGISNLGNTIGTTGVATGSGVQFILAGGNNITLSQSLNGSSATITISGVNTVAQTNQTLSLAMTSNTTGNTSGMSFDARSLTFVGAGAASVGLSTSAGGGSSIIISAAAGGQSVQTLGIYASSQTVGQSSSSTIDARSFTHVGQGIISVGLSAGSLLFSATTSQSVQPLGTQTVGISNLGNTIGTSGVATGTGIQLVLAGGNNVTLSQSLNGSSATITISGVNTVAQTNQTLSFAMTSNTTGNTSGMSVDARSLTFQGAGIVSVGLSTSAGGSSIIVSASAAQTVQTQGFSNTFGMSNLGNTAGTSGVVSGTGLEVFFAGGNNITLSQSINGSTATITVSAFNQSVQPVGTDTIGISNLGNTLGTSGVATGSAVQFVLAGGNNITLSQSLNGSSATVTISAFNQTVQPEGTITLGMSNLGNTVGTSGVVTGTGPSFVFAGGNNITLSQSLNGSSGTITISAFNQTVQPQTNQTLGLYAVGNTVGQSSSSTFDARTLSFDGAGVASVGMSAGSVIISVPTGGGAGFTAGISGGNTAGNTGTTSNEMVLAGGNNITLSGATAAGGMTVSISGPNLNTLGVSNLGHTAGNTGTGAGEQWVFVGSNNITLSVSTNGVSNTITFMDEPTNTINNWWAAPYEAALGGSLNTTVGQSTIYVFPWNANAPLYSASQANIFVSWSISSSSNSSFAAAVSPFIGIYTLNGSSLSLYSSSSGSFQFSNTSSNSFASLTGLRHLSMPFGVSLSQGDYYIAFMIQSASTNANWLTPNMVFMTEFNAIFNGEMGAATNITNQLMPGRGIAPASAALPNSIGLSVISGGANSSRNVVPLIQFIGISA